MFLKYFRRKKLGKKMQAHLAQPLSRAFAKKVQQILIKGVQQKFAKLAKPRNPSKLCWHKCRRWLPCG
jgi:hypothetical protein